MHFATMHPQALCKIGEWREFLNVFMTYSFILGRPEEPKIENESRRNMLQTNTPKFKYYDMHQQVFQPNGKTYLFLIKYLSNILIALGREKHSLSLFLLKKFLIMARSKRGIKF